MIEISCKQCGKSFYTYPSVIKNGRKLYCSKKCMGKYRSQNFVGKNNPLFVDRIKKECLICQKPFFITPYYLKVKKFCSRKCKAIAQSKRMSGKNNPSWQGGVSKKFQRWGEGFTTHLKKQVKIRDNYTCQICKISEKGSKVKFVIHHIDRISKNNSLDNLQLLCTSCHISLHHKIGKAIV